VPIPQLKFHIVHLNCEYLIYPSCIQHRLLSPSTSSSNFILLLSPRTFTLHKMLPIFDYPPVLSLATGYTVVLLYAMPSSVFKVLFFKRVCPSVSLHFISLCASLSACLHGGHLCSPSQFLNPQFKPFYPFRLVRV
jgi:hypothetical protein